MKMYYTVQQIQVMIIPGYLTNFSDLIWWCYRFCGFRQNLSTYVFSNLGYREKIKKVFGVYFEFFWYMVFSIIIGYTWLYWMTMEKHSISEKFKIHPKTFLDFFSIAYVWRHVLAKS